MHRTELFFVSNQEQNLRNRSAHLSTVAGWSAARQIGFMALIALRNRNFVAYQ